MDTKATINIGEYSRRGQSRAQEALKAQDHDMGVKEKLIPGGILEPVSGQAFLFFGQNNKTSDFMADGLTSWWGIRKQEYPQVKTLLINLDNGPECSGRRTQFLQRMVEFANETGLTIQLVYYPPYHSKYNAIERYWSGLEKSWNGYLLDSINGVLKRAGNFVWRGCRAIVHHLTNYYEKGIKVTGSDKSNLEAVLNRSETLKWWDIEIKP